MLLSSRTVSSKPSRLPAGNSAIIYVFSRMVACVGYQLSYDFNAKMPESQILNVSGMKFATRLRRCQFGRQERCHLLLLLLRRDSIMLILSRRSTESIIIGDSIRVKIVEVSGDRVRLAIQAPSNVSVDREEVWERKRSERLQNERREVPSTLNPLLAGRSTQRMTTVSMPNAK